MTNYYSVIEVQPNLMPRMVISFFDKNKAEAHADILNRAHGNEYIVVPSTIDLYLPVKGE